MKTKIDCAVEALDAAEQCPVCNTAMRETDRANDPDWKFRNPDDHMARRFGCGSEFSVDEVGEIICRMPCHEPSHRATYDLNSEAEELLIENQEGAA